MHLHPGNRRETLTGIERRRGNSSCSQDQSRAVAAAELAIEPMKARALQNPNAAWEIPVK